MHYCFALCFIFLTRLVYASPQTDVSRVGKQSKTPDKEDGGSSLVFVFDTTGSMYNDLEQLREGAELILDTALDSENNVISNFVFVPYHDPGVGPATVTKDKRVLKSALNIVRVYGGGTCPEKAMSGIRLGLNVSLPRSYVYVFTDATAGDYHLVNDVLDLVQRKQSQVVFLLTGHCRDLDQPSYKVYQEIAAASSGQIFNLNKTSLHKLSVLEFVRSSISGRMVNLGSAVNAAGSDYTQAIPVDSTLGEVTVSVSGAKPQIKVVNPQGVELEGPPKLITTLDLSEIMVVKVIQPEPGNWTITVGSDEDYSVKVVGLSNLTFHHGFSVQRPKTMRDTTYRPLQGTDNYMVISLTELDRPVTITHAEIVNLDGKILFEIPLKELDSTNKIYLTDTFVPPNKFFYVAISGYDENKHELRRIGATAVQAKEADAPYITTAEEVTVPINEAIVLRCNVESLVPVTAQWYRANKRLQKPVSSLQTTFVDFTIDNMSEEKTGVYRCIAKNIAGVSSASTNVLIAVDPPQLNLSPGNTTLIEGENITIACTAYSETDLMAFQMIVKRAHYEDVITNVQSMRNSSGYYTYKKTFKVSPIDTGMYTCRVKNKGGATNEMMHLNVLHKPNARFLNGSSLTIELYESCIFICRVENANTVEIVAPNGTAVLQRDINRSKIYDVVYNIQNVSLQHNGPWMCLAEKRPYVASTKVQLNVIFIPITKIDGPKFLTLEYGSNYTVNCIVTANPIPTIIWYNETKPMVGLSYTNTKEFVHVSRLFLYNVTEHTEGTYYCNASNSEGVSRDNVTIYVRKNIFVVTAPYDRSVEIYASTQLNCEVDSHPRAEINWYHNRTRLVSNANVRVSSDKRIVVIERMDFENAGTYTCEASNKYETIALNGTLNIHGLENAQLVEMPTEFSVLKGTAVNITCSILSGRPAPLVTLKFKKHMNTTFSDLPKNVIVVKNGTALSISNVNEVNIGIYECIAENVLGRDVKDVQLFLKYPPEKIAMKKHIPYVEVKTGNSVTLSCDVKGEPPPTIVWTKHNQTLKYGRYTYLNETNLIIDQANITDSGFYECMASNAYGFITLNFTLFVYVPSTILKSAMESEIEVLEGQPLELPCHVLGHPPPSVQWTQNGDVIADERKAVDDKHTLRFVANLTDFGEYMCVANNKYGNASVTYNVYIWVPPSIDEPLQLTNVVTVDSNVTLQCNAIGFPIPVIIWEFEGDILKENTTNLSFNNFGNLYIRNTSIENEGMYICIAENIGGFAKKFTYLQVNVPPFILAENYSGPYIGSDMDTLLSLPCRSTGRPPPTINWSKNSIYLHNDTRYRVDPDGALIMLTLSEEMTGNYICTATNDYGAVGKAISVEIYSTPKLKANATTTEIILIENSTDKIECPIKTTRADTVKWYKDGKLLNTGALLKFSNVSRYNESNYACVVSNAIASAVSIVKLVIEWRPFFIDNDLRENIEVIKGDDYVFHCEVDAKPEAEVIWSFNSIPLPGENKVYYRLINIQLYHIGIYTCVVNNIHGTATRRFVMDVLEPPFISDFDSLDVQLKEYSNATLDCNARGTPEPNVKWNYNNTNWIQHDNSLLITNASIRSQGVFRCDARSKAGSTYIVYRVTVAVAARVSQIIMYTNGSSYSVDDKVEIVKGDRVRVACEAAGNPPPLVQWIRNGVVLNDSKLEASYTDVVFENVQSSHAGVYVCSVANDAGGHFKQIKFDVLEPPKIFKSLFEQVNEGEKTIELEVMSSQAFYLHCHPYGNPVPRIYWFIDGHTLRLFDSKMYLTDFGEILVSNAARPEQNGNYTCVARNKIGEVAISYLITVLVPPEQSKDKSTKIMSRVGKTVQLTCPNVGHPAPEVLWLKQPYTHLTKELNPRIEILDDNHTLVISNLEVSDNGKYSCVLTNKVGTVELEYDLIVERLPKILTNEDGDNIENKLVSMRRSIALKCPVDGYPQPKISWLKDTIILGTNLSNVQRALNDNVLIIWNANARDAGQYICIAENHAGTEHRRFNVFVKVPGKWSPWSQWGLCNVTCGLGYQHRSRSCQYIEDDIVVDISTNGTNKITIDDTTCRGLPSDRRRCHMPPCEEEETGDVRGRWSSWSAWAPRCARGGARAGAGAGAGAGAQARARRCRGGAGARCRGDNVQIRKVSNLPPCPENRDKISTDKYDPYMPEEPFAVEPKTVDNKIDANFDPTDVEEFEIKRDTSYTTETSKEYFIVNATNDTKDNSNGTCDAGYKYNELSDTCEDIDECLIENNQCHATQICENISGGYRCSCQAGFAARGAGQRCLDMNECELDVHGCEFACVNVAGGYVCACPRAYRLHADKHHCVQVSSRRRPPSYEDIESNDYLSLDLDIPIEYSKYNKHLHT